MKWYRAQFQDGDIRYVSEKPNKPGNLKIKILLLPKRISNKRCVIEFLAFPSTILEIKRYRFGIDWKPNSYVYTVF